MIRRLHPLAAFTAAVLLLAGLSGCGVTIGDPAPGTTSSTQGAPMSGNSTLDDAGIARIKNGKAARFDFSSGQLSRSAVGLGPGLQSPMVDLRGVGKMALDIQAPHGAIAAETDMLTALVHDGKDTVDELSYFLTTESKEQYVALVRAAVTGYGIDSAKAEEWIRQLDADPTGRHYSALPAGYSTGLEVIYELRFDYDKKVQVIIVTVSPKP